MGYVLVCVHVYVLNLTALLACQAYVNAYPLRP